METHTILQYTVVLLAAAVVAVPIAKRFELGAVLGYLIAGAIIGVSESLGSLLYGGTVGAMIPYAILVLVLLFRPHGLMGEH